jgi:hypothetical protein
MWTTRLADAGRDGHNVILSRDDETFAVIPLGEWWLMSATQFLADKALEDDGLDFKASEIYSPNPVVVPVWTTNLVPAEDAHNVHLLRDGATVAVFSLDEFSELSATDYAVEDAVRVAHGLTEYGSNIEEVKEALKHEEGFEEEEK